MYGREPTRLIDRFLDARLTTIITAQEYKSQLIKNLHTAFNRVKANLREARIRMKTEYDKRTKESNYKINDKVILDFKVVARGNNKKLTSNYEGPYRILEVNDNGTAVILK